MTLRLFYRSHIFTAEDMSPSNSGSELSPGAPLPADFFESEEEEPVSLFAVAGLFVRDARLVLGLPLLAFIVVAGMSMLQTPDFIATSRFMTTQSDQFRPGGNNSGLLSQLGVLMNESRGPSGDYFASVVRSGAVVRQMAGDTFEVTVDGEVRRGTYAELVEEESMEPAAARRQSEALIRRNTVTDEERGTGFIVVSTAAPWPALAAAVNRRLLEVVNEFNMEQRQTQAAVERAFVEDVLAEKEADLVEAERELQQFLETNQQYEGSPRLRFEAARLERQVNMRQQMYTQLAQALEQARLSEVRNTPFIRVVEWPEENIGREGLRSPYMNGFLAAVVTLLVMAGLVLGRAYLHRHSEEHPNDYLEFRRLVHEGLTSRAPRSVRRWVGTKAPPEADGSGQESGRAPEAGPGRSESDATGSERSDSESPESSHRELDTAARR